MADSACDTENAILSLLALKSQEVKENAGRTEEYLALLGITDEDIQALVDNELSAGDQQVLTEVLLFYPVLYRRYEELCRQKEELKFWWSALAPRH